MKVFHRTSKIYALKIKESSVRISKGFYGVGVYCCADVASATTKYSKKHYGNTIVMFELKESHNFIQFTSSEDALEYSKKNTPEGMFYTNKNDGNVVFVGSSELLTFESYSVDNGGTWR